MQVVNEIVMKGINEIKPYFRNPRINEETVNKLVDLLPKVGFNVPIVIDKQGIIIKGHARYTAAIRIGMEQVPCIISEADEEAIKLDRIADNRISEFSQWDLEQLRHELNILTLDTAILDFKLPSLEELAVDNNTLVEQKDIDIAERRQEKSTNHKDYVKFVCEKCGHIGFVEKGIIDQQLRDGKNSQDNI